MSAMEQILARKIVSVVRLDDYTRAVEVAGLLRLEVSQSWNLRSRVRVRSKLFPPLEKHWAIRVCGRGNSAGG